MTQYTIDTEFAAGRLYGLVSNEYGRQVWSISSIRKRYNDPCDICGSPVGKLAFRPVGNKGNRMKRICQRCMKVSDV